MARTFSKSANDFIDVNAKTKTSVLIAEFAVNIAVNDVINIIEKTLKEYCPHKEVCTQQYSRGGCCCNYLNKYINAIKHDDSLCFNKLNEK